MSGEDSKRARYRQRQAAYEARQRAGIGVSEASSCQRDRALASDGAISFQHQPLQEWKKDRPLDG